MEQHDDLLTEKEAAVFLRCSHQPCCVNLDALLDALAERVSAKVWAELAQASNGGKQWL